MPTRNQTPSVVLCALLLAACSKQHPSTEAIAVAAPGPDKQLCKTAIMSFNNAHSMMSDDKGEIVQLTAQQQTQMKAFIQTGLTAGNAVSDEYLTQIHPQLPSEFRSHLLAGWQKYLDGLNHSDPVGQLTGIQLLQKWEQFKERNIDLLYERIIR